MKNIPALVVMLTYDDRTVMNAAEIFEKIKGSKAQIIGFKEEPLPPAQMKALFDEIRKSGKRTALEVVAYTERECLDGARLALECGCEFLCGTVFFDSVNELCKGHGIKYMPYVGVIEERPSVLSGSIDYMLNQAHEYLVKGVYGFDLLGYRYTGDAKSLIERFVKEANAPVCVAGSVDSYEKLDFLKKVKPESFTIGSAFFDGKFGGDFCEQVDKVCRYMEG